MIDLGVEHFVQPKKVTKKIEKQRVGYLPFQLVAPLEVAAESWEFCLTGPKYRVSGLKI